ncbi:hypothetical protein H632_c1634p0 [Helicosporidium sp. ATCC 50920]|nr:hypothetical protein H632_c1634p0 [Helicosporidium sp. ATCC 50920]|eukprot:KDD74033.1 hypothetical protein H632_c1634p0 [Helicosporidium sp. ATCC 50920]
MQSLDAINGVSKLMEGFAVTLDNVIGQAFVDWGTPSARGPRESPSSSRPCGPTPPPAHRQEPSNRKSTEDAGWGDFDVVSESESPKKEKPARRQLGLDNKSNVKPGEGGRVLRLWPAIPQPQPALERRAPPARVPRSPPLERKGLPESVDALVQEQVTEQLKALLREKARLAEENSRLQRERNGLQELLEFTMAQQAECVGDDEIFGNLYGPDEFGACSSSEAASSTSSAGLLPVQALIPLPPEAILAGVVDGAASQS